MESDLKIAFILSLLLHSSIFLIASYKTKKTIYVAVPIEMFFYNAPSGASAAQPLAPQPQAVKPEKKTKEKVIAIPKKIKKEAEKKSLPKAEEKKEAKPSEAEKPKEGSVSPLTPSGQLTVDAARFPYTYYTNMLVKKISRNWQWSVDFGQLKTVVYFKINKDGSVSDIRIKDSSQDRLFDQQAMRSIEVAAPFAPLPAGYSEDELGVYFEFSFKE